MTVLRIILSPEHGRHKSAVSFGLWLLVRGSILSIFKPSIVA